MWLLFVVQPPSRIRLFETQELQHARLPHPPLSPRVCSNSSSTFKFMFIESVMPSNHLILCHPLLPLLSIFLSIRVSSNELALRIRWPEHWSFSFSISPSNEYSKLMSFRMDWFDLLAILMPQEKKSCTEQYNLPEELVSEG